MNNTPILREAFNGLFSNQVNCKWSFRGSEEVEADFAVGNTLYKFYAHTASATVNSPENVRNSTFRKAGNHDRNNRFELSGTGNVSLVMVTVVDSMCSISESRSYIRMVQRLLPAWDVESKLVQSLLLLN